MKEKEEKKLTLNKTTIANLNNSEMKKVEGGQETIAGPHCYTVDQCIPFVTVGTVPCR